MINDNTAQWKLKKITNVTNNFDGYWQAGEAVEVGTLRFPRGQENTGYILECVEAGTTGSIQPEIIDINEVANYADLGRVGQVRVIFNLAEKDVDEVMAMGVTYSRLTYPELWEWAGKRAGLIISEEEWQAKFAESNGKFVPYYSSGDGSSTFRTPLLGAYLKGAETSADVGKWLDAGLPNITGSFSPWAYQNQLKPTGAFGQTATNKSSFNASDIGLGSEATFDASRCSPVYGNSDTVTPETMTGVWVIKAVGVVVDSGETDIANMLQGVETIQSNLTATNNKITGISDYIIESYRNGTEWYEVYKSGKVRQGGQTALSGKEITVTFLKPMANKNYMALLTTASQLAETGDAYSQWTTSKSSTTQLVIRCYNDGTIRRNWYVEGQGA